MRILFHHRIASRDGQAVHMEEMIAALRREGHQVVLVGPSQGQDTEFGSEGGWVTAIRQALPRSVTELLEVAYGTVAAGRLLRALLRHRPDAVYERYNLFSPAGVAVARLFGLPVLLEVNAPLAEERERHGGLAWRRLARWTERITWRMAHRVLPVTQVLAERVIAAGVAPARIEVIANGVDPRRFAGVASARRERGLDGKLVIGFTGFLRPWHGLLHAVDLVAKLRVEHPAHLLLVGDGPARADVEARAQALGIAADVTVTGIVGRAGIAPLVASMDIALQPDVTDYASPLKLFEYMVLGRAIVAPDTPNLREVLTHGQDGLLFRPGDPADFAAAVETLCRDPALRRRLGEGASRTIHRRDFTWDGNARRVIGLVHQIRQGQVLLADRKPDPENALP